MDSYGYGMDPYGAYGMDSGVEGYNAAPSVGPPLVTAPPPVSYYTTVDGTLLQFDAGSGQVIRATPLPETKWPTGGRQAEQALRQTGGRWGARLAGLQAADYTTAKGFATFWLSPNGREVNFRVYLDCVKNLTSVYIHLRDANLPLVASPPIVPLYADCGVIAGEYTGTLAVGAITGNDLMGWLSGHRISSLVQAIDSGEAIVIVHTAQHPQGELEGAISPIIEDDAGA